MAKHRILVLNKISAHGLKRLPAENYEVGPDLEAPDAVLVRSADLHGLEIAASVQAIGRAGVGTNNIPVADMSKRGVPVFNAPGGNANAVSELVLAGMLMGARHIGEALRFVEGLEGNDRALAEQVEAGKKAFAGIELPGRTLGVIGLGAVGGRVAETALRLGMKVQGFDPGITVDAAWRLSSEVRRAASIEDVFRHSDFVSLHVPLIEATRGLANAVRLELLKHGAVLLNFAREGVVDEAAVLAALEAKKLRAYVCDFPTQRLKGQANVIALPHLGASTAEAEDNCAVMVVEQLRDFLENGNIANSVNFPNVRMSRGTPYRLGIANANVPNMLGQISSAMAAGGLNISNMVNKSHGRTAYTLVDLDSAVPPAVAGQLRAIPGVLRVRVLPVAE